jgi:hypothetical protein
VTWKKGLAASTTLTLGCIGLGGVSLDGGSTGGGTRALEVEGMSSSSSSRLTLLIKVLREALDEADGPCGCCWRSGEATGSGRGGGASFPKGPSGPRGS